jgi:zinc/manganese transport system permease protein
MNGFVEMMAAPVVMALILVAMHSHLGWHVVRRGVIFVDIALAQVAAFGVAMSMLSGGEVGTDTTYAIALGSTFLGAGLIAMTRTHEHRIPQEAYIGIIYAVASASMILVLTQVPHGGEEIRHLLVGAILWVTWPIVIKTGVLYGVLGVLLWVWRKPLRQISTDSEEARRSGLRVRLWDLVFYAILGTVVTSSVQVAGVLLVFALLVVPTVMGVRLFRTDRAQFVYTLAIGVATVIAGAAASYWLDLPTGAAIVCVFGVALVLQVGVEKVVRA